MESELRNGRRTVWAATTWPIFDELHLIPLKTSRDVNFSVLTPEEWDGTGTGFVTHLKSEALVELDLLR